MRFLAGFSLLALLTSVILTALLITAGDKPGFLEDLELVNLNTSNIGATLASSPSSPLHSALSNPAITSASNHDSSVAAAINNQANSIAAKIGIHEFYSIHLMDYCEGWYEPNANASDATRNVTACSNSTALWDFNLTQILSSELKSGIPISDLQIPTSVDDGWAVFQRVVHAAYIVYIASACVTAAGIILGVLSCLLDGRITACCSMLWSTLCVLVNATGAVLTTIAITSGVTAINHYSDDIGVVATRGDKFLAMAWASVAVLILGWFTWLVDCCVGGSKHPRQTQRRFGNYTPAYKEIH